MSNSRSRRTNRPSAPAAPQGPGTAVELWDTSREPVITGYRAAQIMTARLKELGSDVVIGGPMIYIYGGKGKFKLVLRAKTLKNGRTKVVKCVEAQSFVPWMNGHIAKILSR